MLKYTGVTLNLFVDDDIDMLLMFEAGVSYVGKRYAKANNKYMGHKYDPKDPSTFITYLDANNLYRWAMSKPLPTGGFRWMSDTELENWEDYLCMLSVDLEYPKHLHDEHNIIH